MTSAKTVLPLCPTQKGELICPRISPPLRQGYNVVVSLLTHQEQVELGLTEEAAMCQRSGLVFAHYAFQDELPASEEHTYDFIDQLKALYQQHKTLLFHCRGGVGRSSMILSLLVSSLGISVEEAFRLISISRGEVVPESERQRQYVIRLASKLQKEGVG